MAVSAQPEIFQEVTQRIAQLIIALEFAYYLQSYDIAKVTIIQFINLAGITFSHGCIFKCL